MKRVFLLALALAASCSPAFARIEMIDGQANSTFSDDAIYIRPQTLSNVYVFEKPKVKMAEPVWTWVDKDGCAGWSTYDEIPDECKPKLDHDGPLFLEPGTPYFDLLRDTAPEPIRWGSIPAFAPVAFAEVIAEAPQPVAAPVVAKHKEPFAVRHPRIHKHYRHIRRICIALDPVVGFAGHAAQVVTMFK